MGKLDIGFIIFIIIMSFILGWSGNELFEIFSNEKTVDGLYISYAPNQSVAMEIAHGRDSKGDWVCTNVKGMDYDECVRVSQHECAHEVFAEFCEQEKYQPRCRDFINSLERDE